MVGELIIILAAVSDVMRLEIAMLEEINSARGIAPKERLRS
jgi:hypothetical protein